MSWCGSFASTRAQARGPEAEHCVLSPETDGHEGGGELRRRTCSQRRRRPSVAAFVAQAVRAKLEAGNPGAVIRILCLYDGLESTSSVVLEKLRELHPSVSGDMEGLPAADVDAAFVVSEDSVRKAVSSFPPGLAGGPNGLTPQHLKNLLASCNSYPDFLPALTRFINTVKRGCCPPEIALFSFGARLLALSKSGGGRQLQLA